MTNAGNFQVFLRPDIGPALQHFFGSFGKRVNLPDGGNALYLSCSRIDTQNAVYLEVTLDGPEAEQLRIPHHLVIAISGPTAQAPAASAEGKSRTTLTAT